MYSVHSVQLSHILNSSVYSIYRFIYGIDILALLLHILWMSMVEPTTLLLLLFYYIIMCFFLSSAIVDSVSFIHFSWANDCRSRCPLTTSESVVVQTLIPILCAIVDVFAFLSSFPFSSICFNMYLLCCWKHLTYSMHKHNMTTHCQRHPPCHLILLLFEIFFYVWVCCCWWCSRSERKVLSKSCWCYYCLGKKLWNGFWLRCLISST